MTEEVDDHRNAERVRQQDEFLPPVVAHITGIRQEPNPFEPLRLGELDVLDERMQMRDEALHDPPEASVRRRIDSAQYVGRDLICAGGHRRNRAVERVDRSTETGILRPAARLTQPARKAMPPRAPIKAGSSTRSRRRVAAFGIVASILASKCSPLSTLRNVG